MQRAFDRVLIVMFENQYRRYVMQDPFMRALAAAGAEMRSYFGAFHPSQTNYLASLAGEVCGVTNDTPPASPLPQLTLVDVLEAAGVTWRAYMEGYPGDPWRPVWQQADYAAGDRPQDQFPDDGARLARYFRKHNAFASFRVIQASEARWSRIVGERDFWDDVAAGQLPQYGWFTPDIWNDGHYLYNTHIDTNPRTQLVPQVSAWLEHVFLGDIAASNLQDALDAGAASWGLGLDVTLLRSDPAAAWRRCRLPARTLLVITFDEADYDARGYDTSYDGPNQVYTVLLGDMIRPGTVIDTPFNHYSLIRTIERNFGAADLGKNDRDANWFRFLWNERFAWAAPRDTGLTASGALAAAADGDGAWLVYHDTDARLRCSRFTGAAWSPGAPVDVASAGPVALARHQDRLLLVTVGADGGLVETVRSATGAWSPGAPLGDRPAGAVAMASYLDEADGQERVMVCWQAASGFIHYRIRNAGGWGDAGEVGQLTDGPMTLAQLGPSLYLVYKERNRRTMRMTSFNLAPFNAFDARTFDGRPDPANSTSLHQWSPFDVPVGHFAGKLAAVQHDYRALGRLAMATADGEMHLVHRGAYDDTPGARTAVFGLTGVFTAGHPASRGWGTIDQAGWTLEQPLAGVRLDPDSGLALAGGPGGLVLVWQPSGSTALQYCLGGYGAG